MNQTKLEDSNLANYGGDMHHDAVKNAARKDKAWRNVGREAGVQIWRIENFRVKHWPKSRYGEFYSGDSYIILHTKVNDLGKKTYDAFFWLGAETTQDEAGTAAYKTVELDELLGDEPVQYREIQGNETKAFLDLFPKVTILSGGVDSGFRRVKPKQYKPRLLHVCGYKRHVQVYQVPLSHESLNNSDSFVLDCGLSVFQFNGTHSSAWEKRKANCIIDELHASRMGKIEQTFIIDGLEDDNHPLIDAFWKRIGGKPSQIAHEEKEEDVPEKTELSLHHICDASGVMEINEVCRGTLDRKKLDSMDTFILDAGGMIFAWIGKGSTKAEKREAMQYAVRYLNNTGRTKDVPIVRIMERKEPNAFWDCFDKGKAVSNRKQKKKGRRRKKTLK
eukprot:661750_1